MTSKQPPRMATWMLKHFGSGPNNGAILGDLPEQYLQKDSAMWYWRQAMKAIKMAFIEKLRADFGWAAEEPLDIATRRKPGNLDGVRKTKSGLFAVEWETGNVSSSHRALNKMLLGMLKGVLIGGVLVVPTRKMYVYLTDRVGNFEELSPYFDFWAAYPVRGVLAVIAVEHDAESFKVPRIEKGTDGRALL